MIQNDKLLGEWKVEKISKNKLSITLPYGMVTTSNDLPIEDILSAIANYYAINSGRKLRKNAREK